MSFNQKTVAGVANLARLHMSDDEQVKFASQIDDILKWVEQLQAVDVDNIEPLVSVSIQEDAMRDDVVSVSNMQDDLLKNAPESAHGFFVVPKMVE